MKIAAIVVTYNRRNLLEKCLEALRNQTVKLHSIVIIDNASTDDTEDWVTNNLLDTPTPFIYLNLHENIGGAGGFNAGLSYAQQNNFEWSWIMDDDALPQQDALEQLLKLPLTPNNIYGSLAINGDNTSWPTTITTESGQKTYNRANEIPYMAEANFIPFLGFFIHSNLVKKIGLPDSGFFIAGDDLEYCLRAKSKGSLIFIAGKSKIHHPKANFIKLKIFTKSLDCLCIPPWKIYYNTRNKIFIAKKYYGIKIFSETVPGIFLRMLIGITYTPNKFLQIYATLAGLIDGALNKTGNRHARWKIPQ